MPLSTKGTSVEVTLSDADLPNRWGAKVVDCTSNDLHLKVVTPPACPVGQWRLKVIAVKQGDQSRTATKVYSHPRQLYILFNPWCKGTEGGCHVVTLSYM